ncbi:MAG: NAD(P)/FAD-dependent oxidoreductase, partial [Myxococcales bacterium]|nr:NAD(P)/FAD-dependent oxidoreductase [Myxococcales bacterium]
MPTVPAALGAVRQGARQAFPRALVCGAAAARPRLAGELTGVRWAGRSVRPAPAIIEPPSSTVRFFPRDARNLTDVGAVVDVAVVGAGHNGLVAATFLARAGLRVRVFEQKPAVGGACKTERPFARAPGLATSTGAYLLGLMPPELISKLGVSIPLVRRDPHYFLPTTGPRYLLFGSDHAATKRQFCEFFSERDWHANEALGREIAALRDDVAPTWMEEPLSIEETAERHVRKGLRATFVDLCRRPIADYLARFDFQSDLVRAMYAVTDAFSGLCGTWNTPGTGMNFLVHNMCRLPDMNGTWALVRGGMGTVTSLLAGAAQRAGALVETTRPVERILVEGAAARGVLLAGGEEVRAAVVLCNADPLRMRGLAGDAAFPDAYLRRLDGYRRDGTTMKVNLALRDLPRFTCLDDPRVYGPTIHLLPEEEGVIPALERAFEEVQAGRLPARPTIEWYIHTTLDPSMRDDQGRHNSALFVKWVPYALSGGRTWEEEEARYVEHLLSICDLFAPGTSELVVDAFALTPPAIERHFGMTRGHIHHVDNGFGFADRLPYATPVAGLYSCSAGTHPAGSVIGCAGH